MDWVDRVTTDVDFSERTEKGKKNGWQHPDRIDGWKDVSPLESLAGARQKDDMIVGLKEVRLSDDGRLFIEREPVQISGTNKALVTFEISGTSSRQSAATMAASSSTDATSNGNRYFV